MKIDATLWPQGIGPMSSALASASGMPFETFVRSPPEDGDAPKTRLAPLPYVFGFDTLGMLGLGGPTGVGQSLKVDAGHETVEAPDLKTASAPLPGVGRIVPGTTLSVAPPVPAVTSQAVASAGPVDAETRQTPAAPDVLPQAPQTGSAAPDRSASGQARPPSWPAFTVAPGLDTGAPSAPVVAAPGPVPALTAELPQDPVTFRKALPAFKFLAQPEPLPGRINVILSESEGVVNVVAAAPDLAESDRQAIMNLADDMAGEAGLTLGGFRLNGVALRPFSKVG